MASVVRELGKSETPTWSYFARGYLVYPLIGLVGATIVQVFLAAAYYKLYNKKKGKFKTFVHTWVGAPGRPLPRKAGLLVSLYILEVIFSLYSVCLFAKKIYDVEVTYKLEWIEFILSFFYAFHFFVLRMQERFVPIGAWRLSAIIDYVTIIPPLLHDLYKEQHRWLSLSYLRAYSALSAWQDFSALVAVNEISPLGTRVVQIVLRMVTMLVCFGCTIMILEILGEIPGYEDHFIQTAMGDLSFVQMFYWMITTVSTVGYGDFSPTTAPARLFIIFVIIFGIIMFTSELEGFLELRSLLASGHGTFVKTARREHIMVTGSGVNKLTSLLEVFLRDCLTSEDEAPDIVFLSEDGYSDSLKHFVSNSIPEELRGNVYFLRGSVMSEADLNRVQIEGCRIAFIIPDTSAPDSAQEDGENILRALELRRMCQNLRVRLMLISPESKETAILTGIPSTSCFAANQLHASVFGQAAKVKGFIGLLAGLLQVTKDEHIEFKRTQIQDGEEWMTEYLWGLKFTLYGFVAGQDYIGMPTNKAAAEVYKKSNGSVLIIAAQYNGELQLNFNGTIKEGQVLIAMAHSSGSVRKFGDRAYQWKKEFVDERQRYRNEAKTEVNITQGFRTGMRTHSNLNLEVRNINQVPFSEEWNKDFKDRVIIASAQYPRGQIVVRDSNFRDLELSWDDDCNPVLGIVPDADAFPLLIKVHQVDRSSIVEKDPLEFEEESKSNPSLMILIVLGDAWEDLVSFLRTARARYLPSYGPIHVISNQPVPEEISKMCLKNFGGNSDKSLLFTWGPFTRKNLEQIAYADARAIAVLAEATGDRAVTENKLTLCDHQAVVIASIVEESISRADKAALEQGLPRPDITTMYEFATMHSVLLFDYATSRFWHPKTTGHKVRESQFGNMGTVSIASGVLGQLSETMDDGRRHIGIKHLLYKVADEIIVWIERKVKVFKQMKDVLDSPESTDDAVLAEAVASKLIFHNRFAAGQVFTPDFFGGLLGRIFHFPATIEFAEALTMPGRNKQKSFPWQVRCPSMWIGKTYGELLEAWCLEADPHVHKHGEPEVDQVGPIGCVLVIAVYRKRVEDEASAGPNGYNVTCPKSDMVLRKSDDLTVLASEAFGRLMAMRRLLRGGEGPIKKEDHNEHSNTPHTKRTSRENARVVQTASPRSEPKMRNTQL